MPTTKATGKKKRLLNALNFAGEGSDEMEIGRAGRHVDELRKLARLKQGQIVEVHIVGHKQARLNQEPIKVVIVGHKQAGLNQKPIKVVIGRKQDHRKQLGSNVNIAGIPLGNVRGIGSEEIKSGPTAKLTTVEGTVTAWLPESGLGFFESEKRRVGFKRKSFSEGVKKVEIGDRVVGEVNVHGFAIKLRRIEK